MSGGESYDTGAGGTPARDDFVTTGRPLANGVFKSDASPTKGGMKLGGKKRAALVRRLWRKFGGICQSCSCSTMPISMTDETWIVGDRSASTIVVSPEGYVFAVATIEHIRPLALGGTNDEDNLTLWCHDCNQKGAIEVRAVFGKRVFRNDRKPVDAATARKMRKSFLGRYAL